MIIRWSYRAQKQQDAVADYIFKEFGTLALREFYQKIDKVETDLVEFPEIGKLEPLLAHRKKLYRSIMLTKMNKLIYTINNDYIYVHAVWDTRREPKSQASKL
jgi:plasmid stabilization system protein ParE